MNNNKEKMERIVSNLKIYDHLSEDYRYCTILNEI